MSTNQFSLHAPTQSTVLRARLRPLIVFQLAILLSVSLCAHAFAQRERALTAKQKLPTPEKIVGNYLKAVGGKKRLAAIKDTTSEWSVQFQGQPAGTAKIQTSAPFSAHLQIVLSDREINSVSNASSAWTRGLDGGFRTLTGAEAGAARLQALLDASHLVDYKKLNVLARTISLDETSVGEPSYIVEFSSRSGTRLRYWFGASTKLLLKTIDDARHTTLRFSDYRAEGNLLEPHRIEMSMGEAGALTLALQRIVYNTGLAAAVFDPPSAETLDVAALLREVSRNQDLIDERVGEYSFMEKRTAREINNRGEVKKETVRVYEVFPVPGRGPVFKLISENGVRLSAERAEKEDKRVGEELEKAERERAKQKDKRERERAERATKKIDSKPDEEKDDPGIAQFLRACEFVSPRREQLRGRDAVVFDFRARPNFHPASREEDLISKLVGVVWIDPVDKQVIRLEARLKEGFKMAGGLLLSLRPGAAFVVEQTRMNEGVWLPLFAQVNLSVKVLLFVGNEINTTFEWSDYQHFNAETSGYKIDSTPANSVAPAKPNP